MNDQRYPIPLISITLLLATFSVQASQDAVSGQPGVPHYVSLKNSLLAGQAQAVKEAAEAIDDTQRALAAIEKNQPQAAEGILQEALAKLDAVATHDPSLKQVPAAVDTDIVELVGDAATVKNALENAEEFLDDGKVQEARQILAGLVSEAQVTVTSIPLQTYPAALKNALQWLKQGKTLEAGATVYKTLNTLDRTTRIMPLPVLKAEILLSEASEIEHRQDLTQADSRAKVLNQTAAAKAQLQLAQLLGYGGKEDYQDLYAAIDKMEDVVFSEQSSATWAKIKEHLASLKNKLSFFKK